MAAHDIAITACGRHIATSTVVMVALQTPMAIIPMA